MTLRHLLSHTSGLSPDPDFPPRIFAGGPGSLRDHVVEDIPHYRVAGPPGEIFWYSGPGYNIAGHLAEHVTGQPFARLMDELVFAPCGLESTTFDTTHPSRAKVTDLLEEALVLVGQIPPIPYPAGYGVSARDIFDELTGETAELEDALTQDYGEMNYTGTYIAAWPYKLRDR